MGTDGALTLAAVTLSPREISGSVMKILLAIGGTVIAYCLVQILISTLQLKKIGKELAQLEAEKVLRDSIMKEWLELHAQLKFHLAGLQEAQVKNQVATFYFHKGHFDEIHAKMQAGWNLLVYLKLVDPMPEGRVSDEGHHPAGHPGIRQVDVGQAPPS